MFKTSKTILLFLFLSFLFSLTAPAQPISILVSIASQTDSAKIVEQVKKQLAHRGFLNTEYRIHTNADQFDLYQALNDPKTRALLWISHGASSKRKVAGMAPVEKLVDYRGDDVAPVFKKYSAALQFVAVLGCQSKSILSSVGSTLGKNDSDKSEQIETFIPTKKIFAQSAIRQSIKKMKLSLARKKKQKTPDQPTNHDPTETITFVRSIPVEAHPENLRSLRILSKERLLTVLPAGKPDITTTDLISVEGLNIVDLRIETGQSIMTPPENIIFGEITITLPNGKKMVPFSKIDGTPFGLNFRYFLPDLSI